MPVLTPLRVRVGAGAFCQGTKMLRQVVLCGVLSIAGWAGFSKGALDATFMTPAYTTLSVAGGGAEFASASATVFVDPSITQWIAWNDAATVSRTHPSRPGELFLGPGGIGVDDFVRLSVVNLQSNQSLTFDIDQNDGFAVSSGTQNVIFGAAAVAPDVLRDPGGFPGPVQFLDDPPSHNAIFTSAGNYQFNLSFRNVYGSSAAHPDVWLLVATVPEPSLAAAALLPL